MTTLSFYAASGQTICRITTNKCRDVSQHSQEHLLNIPSFSWIQTRSVKHCLGHFFRRICYHFKNLFFSFAQLMQERIVQCLMGCMNSVSSQQGDLLVSFSLSALNFGVGGGGGGVQIECYQIRYNLYYQGHLQVKKKNIHIMIEFYNIRISKFIAILKKINEHRDCRVWGYLCRGEQI